MGRRRSLRESLLEPERPRPAAPRDRTARTPVEDGGRVAWRAEGPISTCRATVAQRLALSGGEAVRGWQIHIWPGLFIEALSHWVWRDQAGRLVDLSAKYPTDPARFTTFAPGEVAWDENEPSSRHFVLHYAPEVQVLLTAAREQAELTRAVEARTRRSLGPGRPSGLLLDHADPEDRALLDDQAQWVGVAIRACSALAAGRRI